MGNKINSLFSGVQGKLAKVHQPVRAESTSCSFNFHSLLLCQLVVTMLAIHMDTQNNDYIFVTPYMYMAILVSYNKMKPKWNV